jgi:hypothetical protein
VSRRSGSSTRPSRSAPDPGGPAVQVIAHRQTGFGPALYIKISRHDDRPMAWPEIAAVFNDRYPGRWAAQFFPPAEETLDEANIYHLFVLEDEPAGVNILRRH